MGFVWTIAEQYQGRLKAVSFELLARGRKLADKMGTKLVSVLIGDGLDRLNLESLIQGGADEVYSLQDPRLANFICENYARIIARLIAERRPSIILAAATSSGRTLMPYLAIKMHAGLTADCTELDIEEGTDNLLQTRPAIGGNIMATIKTPNHRPQMATVRPKSCRPLSPDQNRKGDIVDIPVADDMFDPRVAVLGYRTDTVDFVNVEEADIVVAGGRGLKKADNFVLVRNLAAESRRRGRGKQGGRRPRLDRVSPPDRPERENHFPETVHRPRHIGFHTASRRDKDQRDDRFHQQRSDANLHKIADFAIVGDLFQVLPELQRRIAARHIAATGVTATGIAATRILAKREKKN